MSVVSVQATVGAHLAADDPMAARQALLTISDVSRSSMQDLRQMLTLLRDDSPAAARTPSATSPPWPRHTRAADRDLPRGRAPGPDHHQRCPTPPVRLR